MFDIDRLERLIQASLVLEVVLVAVIVTVWLAGL